MAEVFSLAFHDRLDDARECFLQSCQGEYKQFPGCVVSRSLWMHLALQSGARSLVAYSLVCYFLQVPRARGQDKLSLQLCLLVTVWAVDRRGKADGVLNMNTISHLRLPPRKIAL